MFFNSRGKAPASRFQKARLRYSLFGFALFCGFLTAAGAQRNSGARPALKDGRAILQESIKTYQEMSSYEGQSNVDTLLLDKNGDVVKQVGSAARLRYKRPNKLMLDFSTPGGSRSIWSNGSLLIVYDALPKKYTVGPTSPDLPSMLPLLFRRADVSASLDPLYCLSQKTLPKELTNLTLKETTVYNGHPVYVVTGVLNGIDLTNVKGQSVNLQPSVWTWWVDRNTFLLHKIESRTPNVIKPISKKVGQREEIINMTTTLLMRHTMTYSKPNTAIPDDAFVFKAPPDATERRMSGQ